MGIGDSKPCFKRLKNKKLCGKIYVTTNATMSEKQITLIENSWTLITEKISRIGVVTFMK